MFYPETNKVEKVRCVKFIDNFQAEQDEHDLISNRERGENTDKPEAKIPNINEEQNTQEFETEQVGDDKDIHEQHKQDIYAERYPTRARNKPNYFEQNKLDDNTSYTIDYCYRLANIPVSYKQAVDAPDANRWQEAMNTEMKALTDNETFELVPHPKDGQVVGAKWVYTVKTNQNGEEKYKARFVAKGYSQVQDIDYKETCICTNRTYEFSSHFIATHGSEQHDSSPDGR